jgi:hypothetical protein
MGPVESRRWWRSELPTGCLSLRAVAKMSRLTSLMSEKCKANVSIDAAGRCLLQLLKNAGGPWPQRMPLINSYSVFSLSVFPRRGVTFDLNGWSLPGRDVAAESRRIRLMMRSRVS